MDGVKPADSVDYLFPKQAKAPKQKSGRDSPILSRHDSPSSFAQMLKKTSQKERSTSGSPSSASSSPELAPRNSNRTDAASVPPSAADKPAPATSAAPPFSEPSQKGSDVEDSEFEGGEFDGREFDGLVSIPTSQPVESAVPAIPQPSFVDEVSTAQPTGEESGSLSDGEIEIAKEPATGEFADVEFGNTESITTQSADVQSAKSEPRDGVSNFQFSATSALSHGSGPLVTPTGESGGEVFSPEVEQFSQPAESELLALTGIEDLGQVDAANEFSLALETTSGNEQTINAPNAPDQSDQQTQFFINSNSPNSFSAHAGAVEFSDAQFQPTYMVGEVPLEIGTTTAESAVNLQDTLQSQAETPLEVESPPPAQSPQSLQSNRSAGAMESTIPSTPSIGGNRSEQATAEGLVDRIGTTVMQALNGGKVMRMRMHPPELGILQIEVTSIEGTVTARLDVESARAHRAILENLPQLHEMLNKTNTHVERIELNILEPNAGSEGSSSQSRNPTSHGDSSKRPFSPNGSVANQQKESGAETQSLEKSRQTQDWQSRSSPLFGIDIQV